MSAHITRRDVVCISTVPVGKGVLAPDLGLVPDPLELLIPALRSADKNVSSVLDGTIHH